MGTRKIKIIHKQFKFKIEIAYVDPWDMLNNFCFHVYAQKSLFVGENYNVFLTPTPPSPVSLDVENRAQNLSWSS